MIDTSFESLIEIVPLKSETKTKLEKRYAEGDSMTQSELLGLLYGIFRTYRSVLRSQLTQEYSQKMIDGEFVPQGALEDFIEMQVEIRLKEKQFHVKETEELSQIRQKLEQFMDSA